MAFAPDGRLARLPGAFLAGAGALFARLNFLGLLGSLKLLLGLAIDTAKLQFVPQSPLLGLVGDRFSELLVDRGDVARDGASVNAFLPGDARLRPAALEVVQHPDAPLKHQDLFAAPMRMNFRFFS